MDSIYGFSIFDGLGYYSEEKWAEIRAREQTYLDEVYQAALLKKAREIVNNGKKD